MELPAHQHNHGDQNPDRNDAAARVWLGEAQWQTILEQVERQCQDVELKCENQRNSPRMPAPGEVHCLVRMDGSCSNNGTYCVKLRNVSATGLGFLTTDVFEPESRCTVVIKNGGGGGLVGVAQVVWCQPVGEELYEVGVRFDNPTDTDQFFT
jgi:hypothetical protein